MLMRCGFSFWTSACTAASRTSDRRSTLVYLRGGGPLASAADANASRAHARSQWPERIIEFRMTRPLLHGQTMLRGVFYPKGQSPGDNHGDARVCNDIGRCDLLDDNLPRACARGEEHELHRRSCSRLDAGHRALPA